jgi:hypothetical protein
VPDCAKTIEITEVVRLTPQIYRVLEERVSVTAVTSGTTELQAAWMLGVQHVLKMLREGYVLKE